MPQVQVKGWSWMLRTSLEDKFCTFKGALEDRKDWSRPGDFKLWWMSLSFTGTFKRKWLFSQHHLALWIYEDQVGALWYKLRVLIQQVQEATAVDILRVMKEDSATSIVDVWTKVMGLMLDVLVIKGLHDWVWLDKGSFQQLVLMELPPGST